MVVISWDIHGNGVVLCKQYFGSITSANLFDIVKSDFPAEFKRNSNPNSQTPKKLKPKLMDGYPRQNRATTLAAVKWKGDISGKISKITTARCPDLNPIKKVYDLASAELGEQTVAKI